MKPKLVVYYPSWAIYRKAGRNNCIGAIPWDRVSVINHAFYFVGSDFKIASTDKFADEEKIMEHSDAVGPKGHMGEYAYYKARYPDVKVQISVGGWTEGCYFHDMAKTPESRSVFIKSVIELLKNYPFIDGIDIDWEFPGIDRPADPNDVNDKGCPGGPEDKQNFTSLLRELRDAYIAGGMAGKLLTVAVSALYDVTEHQEPDKYAQYIDWINVMTYDMHSALEEHTNHHSPLFANPVDPSPVTPVDKKNKYNTDFVMKYYRDRYNIPANKLNIGAPYYSRGWKNIDPDTGVNGLYARGKGSPVGDLDSPVYPAGMNTIYRMKELEITPGYVKYRDPVSRVPWLYNKDEKVMYTYEDEVSAAERCDYVLKNGFGGIIVWEITTDTDDHLLTNTIHDRLGL